MKNALAFVLLSVLQLPVLQSFASEPSTVKLKGRPSTRQLLRRSLEAQPSLSSGTDTLRLLAIRVEFVADTLEETTGNGTFDLTPRDAQTIDPPPHNRAYFAAQLQALSQYYNTVSNGKLVLTWTVLPEADETAFQLPRDMLYYAPRSDTLEDRRLAELFRDGLQAADQSGNIPFSEYDSFILFHAGVGRDIGFDFDPTPGDVPSAFLSLADLRESLGGGDANYRGISVENGRFFVPDGIILPETESQEGFQIGLLGTAAIMFGFQLGLPALFNIDTGASGIGSWGLMDQGSGNFAGLLPAEPSAWEKVYLGWEQPIVVQNAAVLNIAAPRVQLIPNKIYKIPISDDEYFLVENRQRDLNQDGAAVGRDAGGNRVVFRDAELQSDPPGRPYGVIVSVDEYDYGLPGSGILIWHVDERIIRENLPANRVNADRDRRGVDLEEADGAQDIGQTYGFLDPGVGAENGVPEDAWWDANPVITEFLRPGEPVYFDDDTQPPARANSGARSHIRLHSFSALKPIMSFSVQNDLLVDGFPQFAGTVSYPPVVADFDTDKPGFEAVSAARNGIISAWQANGNSLWPAAGVDTLRVPGKEIRQMTLARFLDLDVPITTPPAAGDLDGDGAADLIVALGTPAVAAYAARDRNDDNRPDRLWLAPLGARPTSNLSIDAATGFVWAGLESGELIGLSATGGVQFAAGLGAAVTHLAQASRFLLASAGENLVLFAPPATEAVWQHAFEEDIENIAIADLDNDDALEFVGRDAAGNIAVLRSSGQVLHTFAAPDLKGAAGLAVGDADGDGRKDLVFSNRDGVFAYHFHGASLQNFPVRFDTSRTPAVETAYNSPLLLDTNADGVQEVFATSPGGDLYALNTDGRQLSGFPFALNSRKLISGRAADLDGDGRMEMVVFAGEKTLSVIRLPGAAAETAHAWTGWGNTNRLAFSTLLRESPAGVEGVLLPARQAYNYPNPTEGNLTTIRYRLNAEASVRIKILDLAGELVDQFPGPAIPNADNEILWRVDNVQSGVYLARIEARNGQQREVVVFKIAVVK